MTREELDFIGSMNMCDEISNEAYKKIVCHCEGQEPCENAISRQAVLDLAKKGVLVSNGNYESVCKAINKLPPVNPQPCEDAISRQAAIESIKNLYPDMPIVDIMGSRQKWLNKYAPYIECEHAIERSPSVNPQPKTGHWIDADGDNAICGCCNRLNHLYGIYCKHCGAKMVDPQEREG